MPLVPNQTLLKKNIFNKIKKRNRMLNLIEPKMLILLSKIMPGIFIARRRVENVVEETVI